MKIITKMTMAGAALLPMLAQAHPGHHQHDAGFWTGFIHPFTGLDHLVMVLSFGVLMWTVSKQGKMIGALGLVMALLIGFAMGAQKWIPVSVAEYGIIASLLVVAVAMWTKSNRMLVLTAMILTTFHGTAHGVELGAEGHVLSQMMGMISAMAVLYATGLGLGALITLYVPQAKKLIGAIAAAVAVLGLI